MNNANFAGRLGRDAETRKAGETTATGFSLAVDERGPGGEKQTLWIDCTVWGTRGEKLEEFLTKGKQVAVSGRVGIRQYDSQGETRAVLTLRVAELTLMGGGERTEGSERAAPASAPAKQQPARAAPAARPAPAQDFADDDIPF